MNATVRRLTSLLLMAFFVHCVMLHGVAPTKRIAPSGHENIISILTMDVCGQGATSGALQPLDLKAGFPAQPVIHFPVENAFPRTTDEAVASTPPGEIEKPPEA